MYFLAFWWRWVTETCAAFSKASARERSPTKQYLWRHFLLFSRRTFAGARFAERSTDVDALFWPDSSATSSKSIPSESEMPRNCCESILLNYLQLMLNFKLKCLISPSISLAWFAVIKFPRKRKGLAGNLEITHWYSGPLLKPPSSDIQDAILSADLHCEVTLIRSPSL